MFFPGTWLPEGVLSRNGEEYGPPTSGYLIELIRRFRRYGHSYPAALELARLTIRDALKAEAA